MEDEESLDLALEAEIHIANNGYIPCDCYFCKKLSNVSINSQPNATDSVID